MPPFIQINGQRLSADEIENFSPSSPFEENAIDFIQLWQTGKTDFKMQTSGSTGKPKIITISRRQMEASARFTIEALGLKTGQTALICLDTRYIAGKMMLVRALVNHMNIVLATPGANPLLHLDTPADFAALVPLQLEGIIANPDTAAILNSMHALIVGGASVNSMLLSKIQSVNTPIYATYGMTETVSHIALKRLNGPEKSEAFTAFDEVRLGLDDRGCLTIESVLSNNTKIITNDRVLLHDSHHFEWLGRVDNVINTGGIKVQSEKVEQVVERILNDLGIHHRFFVAGMPDDRLGEKVVLVVETVKPPGSATTLINQLKACLNKYEVPREILCFPQFEETETGKVKRKETLRQHTK